MLDSAAGDAAGAPSWANAGIANAAAKKAAESTERVRFIFLDLLGYRRPLMGRGVTIGVLLYPCHGVGGKI
jgi:hypothetical protein